VRNPRPDIHARLIAAVIDSTLITSGLVLTFVAYHYLLPAYKPVLYLLSLFVLFGYEPLQVAFRGRTFGQWIKGYDIVDAPGGGHIGVGRALLRYLLKYSLWPFSLTWMYFTDWRCAWHDTLTGSVALRTPEVSGIATAPPRPTQRTGKKRWIFVTFVWLLVLLVSANMAYSSLFPQCGRRFSPGYCAAVDWISDLVNVAIWLGVFYFGSSGRLPGSGPAPRE